MKTIAPMSKGASLALAAVLALAGACSANHVLGTKPLSPDGGAAGTNGSPGTAAPTAGATGFGVAGTSGAAGDAAAGTSGAAGNAAGGVGGLGFAGTSGAAGLSMFSPSPTGAAGTGASGAAGVKIMAGPLGPPTTWTGYVEDYTFRSGSDALTMTFGTDAKGIVKGTIVLGAGTPPPPATDPNIGWPAGVVDLTLFSNGDGYVAEGYTYAYDGGSFDTHRLRFTVNLWQLWAGWCALQTPPVDGSTGCIPNWGGSVTPNACSLQNPSTGANVPIDCTKLALCLGSPACTCNASGCTNSDNSDTLSFDLFVTDDTASGTIDGVVVGKNNIHFVKQ
jgi:hypothetical protein